MGELGSSALKSQKSNKVVKGGGLGLEQGHVTLLRPQNVPDGFKQCHLKAPYVTEKQIKGGRGGGDEEEGRVGRRKPPPPPEARAGPVPRAGPWSPRPWGASRGRGLLCSLMPGLEEAGGSGPSRTHSRNNPRPGGHFRAGLRGKPGAHPGAGGHVCSDSQPGARAQCWVGTFCPESVTVPRATATVCVWVGRGQAVFPGDTLAGKELVASCEAKLGGRSLSFQETHRKLLLSQWPGPPRRGWGVEALAPAGAPCRPGPPPVG